MPVQPCSPLWHVVRPAQLVCAASPLMTVIMRPVTTHGRPQQQLSSSPCKAGRRKLHEHLQELWQEQAGAPICYTWIDWLQSSALAHLGISDTLRLAASSPQPRPSSHSTPLPSSAASAAPFAPSPPHGRPPAGSDPSPPPSGQANGTHASGASRQDACEADELKQGSEAASGSRPSTEQVLMRLLQYDASRRTDLFRQGLHTCNICFEEQPGETLLPADASACHSCGDAEGLSVVVPPQIPVCQDAAFRKR